MENPTKMDDLGGIPILGNLEMANFFWENYVSPLFFLGFHRFIYFRALPFLFFWNDFRMYVFLSEEIRNAFRNELQLVSRDTPFGFVGILTKECEHTL